MNIIFFGNSQYSLIGAKILHEKLGISTIVTKTDRPDKKGKLHPSLLKTFGLEQKIPVITANKLDDETIKHIEHLQPDFFVVEDYGLILPQKLLALPRYAPLNIHHSMLPKYRGPAPVPFAILAGEKVSGVSVIHMANKVDAGDVYAQQEFQLRPDETTDSLLKVLNELGGHSVVTVIHAILAGKAKSFKQDEQKAIFTTYMKKSDAYIQLKNPPEKDKLDRMIRAYYPWPTVWTTVNIKDREVRLKFLPGDKFQLEGKNPVSGKEFRAAYPELREKIEKLFK